jgi:hypothetical protein
MAGVAEAVAGEPVRAGVFSRLARQQYGALADMRWAMFRHGMRTTKGAVETVARVVVIVVYSCIGCGMATGFGIGAYAVAAHGHWNLMPIFLWALFFMWQIVPVSLASFQQQFDLGGLLRFPVSFGAFYLLHLIFGPGNPDGHHGGASGHVCVGRLVAGGICGVQHSSGARHLCVDRSLAGAAADAGDSDRCFSCVDAVDEFSEPCVSRQARRSVVYG